VITSIADKRQGRRRFSGVNWHIAVEAFATGLAGGETDYILKLRTPEYVVFAKVLVVKSVVTEVVRSDDADNWRKLSGHESGKSHIGIFGCTSVPEIPNRE